MTRLVRRVPAVTALVVFASTSMADAGNTTCTGNYLDWYTDVVGETPCMTYQRLRQICNSNYQVPVFRPNTPGDNCDDQLETCCCNSISWSLSMLCMNCQAFQAPNGIDAGAGAYGIYRIRDDHFCSPGTNMTLPDDIQTAVCNANIRLDNFLYDLFWNTGDWFYEFTREYATEKHIENNNNTFTHCPNQISSSATPTSGSTSSLPLTSTTVETHPPTRTGQTRAQAVVTGVGIGGGLVLLGLLCGVLWFYCRKRKPMARRLQVVDHDHESTELLNRWTPVVGHMDSNITPFVTSDDGTYVDHPTSGARSGFSKQDHSTSKATSPSGLPSTSHEPPSTSSRIRSSPSQSDVLPGRHEDAGVVLVSLERSASGRLPPEYMSWNAGERPDDVAVTPEAPVRSPEIHVK